MKKKLRTCLTMVSCCVLTVLLMSGCSTADVMPRLELPRLGGPVPSNIEITWALDEIPEFPSRLMVYELVERDRAQVEKHLENYLADGKYKLEFYEGGQFLLRDQAWKFSPFIDDREEELKQLPTEEEAIQIAINFLKDIGYYSPDLSLTQVGFDSVERFKGDERTVYQVNWCIPFGKSIENYRIMGAGVSVRVGHAGNIDDLSVGYMEIKPFREVDIITVEEAYTRLINGEGSLAVLNMDAEEALIEKVELVYYQPTGPISEQPYLQPLYFFAGTVRPATGEYNKWQGMVPAIRY